MQRTSPHMQDMGIISPSFEQFQTLAKTRRVIPVYTKILADSLTPIGLYRALVLRDGTAQAGTFLLESAAENAQWSRYSFIGAHSRATLTTSAGEVFWQGETPAGAPTDGLRPRRSGRGGLRPDPQWAVR